MYVRSLEVAVGINLPRVNPQLKLRAAYSAAMKSTDRTTHVGAVLVDQGWNVLAGCNAHTKGYGDMPEHHERPLKYQLTEHAERDVLLRAACEGIITHGLTMYAPWATCPDCARAIVKAGIDTVVCHKECMDRSPERWTEMLALGREIMQRGGVNVIVWCGEVGECENLFNGELWLP
jgi:dCMP deaminase